jgi:hypothetical protein
MFCGRSVEVRGDEDAASEDPAKTASKTGQGTCGRRREDDGLGRLGRLLHGRTLEGGVPDEVPGSGIQDHLYPASGPGDLAGYLGGRERSGPRPDRMEDQGSGAR